MMPSLTCKSSFLSTNKHQFSIGNRHFLGLLTPDFGERRRQVQQLQEGIVLILKTKLPEIPWESFYGGDCLCSRQPDEVQQVVPAGDLLQPARPVVNAVGGGAQLRHVLRRQGVRHVQESVVVVELPLLRGQVCNHKQSVRDIPWKSSCGGWRSCEFSHSAAGRGRRPCAGARGARQARVGSSRCRRAGGCPWRSCRPRAPPSLARSSSGLPAREFEEF